MTVKWFGMLYEMGAVWMTMLMNDTVNNVNTETKRGIPLSRRRKVRVTL